MSRASKDDPPSPLACPIDGAPMAIEELARGVEVPICSRCSVHWFRALALRRHARARGRVRRLDPQLRGVAAVAGAPALACPDCGTLSLAAHRYRAETLRRCARCEGMLVPVDLVPWLDAPSTPHDPVDPHDDGFPRGRNWFTRLLWRAARLVVEWAADLVGK